MAAKSESLNMVFLVGGPVDKMTDGISHLGLQVRGLGTADRRRGTAVPSSEYAIQVLVLNDLQTRLVLSRHVLKTVAEG